MNSPVTPHHALKPPAGNGFARAQLEHIAFSLAAVLEPRDRIFLEGPLGAGKTTFVDFLLTALKTHEGFAGSPTFGLVFEYTTAAFKVFHLDFYRLTQEREIQDAGLFEYFFDPQAIQLCEWISLFPNVKQQLSDQRHWDVTLDFAPNQPETHRIITLRCSDAEAEQKISWAAPTTAIDSCCREIHF